MSGKKYLAKSEEEETDDNWELKENYLRNAVTASEFKIQQQKESIALVGNRWKGKELEKEKKGRFF